jgi:Holliday junction resolvasome RuvABC DNA-binding subunit
MRRLLTIVTGALCALAILTPAAPAKLTSCPTNDPYSLIKVDGVGCKRAAKVAEKWFADNESTPFGFTCKQKQYPGGVTTTCRKGDKKFKHFSAD